MNKLTILFCVFFLFGCSDKEKSDKELLDLDTAALNESLHTEKVIAYKFCKIMMRASADTDTTSAKHKEFRTELRENAARIEKLQKSGNLSVSDYVSMFRDYQKMRTYVINTDEDIFPTLLESSKKSKHFLKGKKKVIQETKEHALLSALVVLSRDLGKEVSLYECSQTDPSKLEDSEMKSLLLFYRGMLFLEKGFYYLSEKETTDNIEWLEKNQKTDLKLTRTLFGWSGLNASQTHTSFLAMNYLFRGVDRIMMKRKIDEERSLEDLEKFISLMAKLGVANELTWTAEAYVHLKKGETDKAIIALEKLSKSKKLSAAEKTAISKTIEHLKNKGDRETALTDIYDTIFMGQVVSGYVYDRAAALDWNTLMIKQKVPYAHNIIATVKAINTVSGKIARLENGETLKETGSELKKEGESFMEKAKGLFD